MVGFVPSVQSYGAVSASGMRTSQNGWPASPSPSDVDIVTVPIPLQKGTKNIQVARKAADAMQEIITWWDANVEPVTELGSYNYREIRGYEGTGTLSNHSSGTAVDINASKHPLGAEGTVSAAMQALIIAKAASLGLRWGGEYRGRKDEMHFEVVLAPTADMFRKVGTNIALIWVGTSIVGLVGVAGFLALKKYKKAKHHG